MPTPPTVTETELSIMETLWRLGAGQPIGRLVEELYEERSASTHATVQSLLGRLEAKGCVRRRRDGRAYLYEAVVGRDEVIGHELKSLAERLCDGSMAPLLTHLVRATRLTMREREELRGLLQSLESPAKPPKRRP
jgi:BlaI family transcriptional regulator, penicillinase repressor